MNRKTLELLNLILKGSSSCIIIHRCLYVILSSHSEGMVNVNENHDTNFALLACTFSEYN